MKKIKSYFVLVSALSLLIGGAASQAAAEVEALGAVGYVTVDIPEGGKWVQVATPFDSFEGMLGNPMTVDEVFGDHFPDATEIQFFDGSSYEVLTCYSGEWYDDAWEVVGNREVPRGTGCWLRTPGGTEAGQLMVAGQVPEDELNEVTLTSGYTMFSFGFPTATLVDDALLNAGESDEIQLYDPNGGAYEVWTHYGGVWYDSDWTADNFTFQPGLSYWYRNAGAAFVWFQPKLYD